MRAGKVLLREHKRGRRFAQTQKTVVKENPNGPGSQGVSMDERRIPVLATISAEAQAMLHAAVRDDGKPPNAFCPTSVLEDLPPSTTAREFSG